MVPIFWELDGFDMGDEHIGLLFKGGGIRIGFETVVILKVLPFYTRFSKKSLMIL